MKIRDAAILCHNVNKAYCALLGDNSQVKWGKAEKWQQDSAIKGVEFHLANPDASPSASHDSWMKQKVDDGWVFGVDKDPENKTHPCIVNFNELPPEQQVKDVLFKNTVDALRPLLES